MNIFGPLLGLIAPRWKSMALGVLLGFLTTGSSIGLLATSAYLIAWAALHPPVLDLMPTVAAVRFFGLARAVFRYLERYVTHQATLGILSQIRVWLYNAIEPLAPGRLTGYHSGQLWSRLVADVESLQHFYLRVLAPPLVALMVLAVVSGFLAWINHNLALVYFLIFLLAGIGGPVLARLLGRGLGRRLVEVKGRLNTYLVDSLRGMTEIVAFGQKQRFQEQVAGLSHELAAIQGRAARINALAGALTGVAMHLAMWTVLVLAIPLVSSGQLEGIWLAVLALGVWSSFEAVTPLTAVYQHLEEGLQAGRRIFHITVAQPVVPETPSPSPTPAGFQLRVKDLGFWYTTGGQRVLDGIDFTLPAGGRLAIVGPSGAGKSTLAHLLLRFWDYTEGSITLGGRELKEYDPDQIRAWLGVVSQHTHLFNATIRENLALARPDATEAEMWRVLAEVGLLPFVQGLPHGLDTYVGEGGFKLSGGQRQLLAIARALLRNTPILVLDEATRGLDSVTEREVLTALFRLREGRSTLIITHRLAGMEHMDEILVLNSGRVVERGNHRDLLHRQGLYYKMWKAQRQVLVASVPNAILL